MMKLRILLAFLWGSSYDFNRELSNGEFIYTVTAKTAGSTPSHLIILLSLSSSPPSFNIINFNSLTLHLKAAIFFFPNFQKIVFVH